KPLRFAPEALAALEQYAWPGNIRELRNVVERLLLLAEGEVDGGAVELALPNAKRVAGGAASAFFLQGPLSERVARFERETVLAELERNHHHVTNTAKALGLERSHLYKKCQQLAIDVRQVE
ncbi:MAG: helix-turn-helix domain-containing protein, partial [Silvibacterium sp.]